MNIECWRHSGYNIEIEDISLPYAILLGNRGHVANIILAGVDINEYKDFGYVGIMRWTGTTGKEFKDSILDPDGKWVSIENEPPIPESPPFMWNSDLYIMGYLNSIHKKSIILWPPQLQHIEWLYTFLRSATPYHHKNLSISKIHQIFDIEDILDMDRCIRNGSPIPDKLMIYDFENPHEIYTIRRLFFGIREEELDDMSCKSKCIWMYQGNILRCRHHPYVEGMGREYARSLQWWDLPEELYQQAKENEYTIYNSKGTEMKCTALFSHGRMKYLIYDDKDSETVILNSDTSDHSLLSLTQEDLHLKLKGMTHWDTLDQE